MQRRSILLRCYHWQLSHTDKACFSAHIYWRLSVPRFHFLFEVYNQFYLWYLFFWFLVLWWMLCHQFLWKLLGFAYVKRSFHLRGKRRFDICKHKLYFCVILFLHTCQTIICEQWVMALRIIHSTSNNHLTTRKKTRTFTPSVTEIYSVCQWKLNVKPVSADTVSLFLFLWI